MVTRRRLLGTGAAMVAARPLLRADVPDHLWQGHDFGPGPKVTGRLNQRPFAVEQDEGWGALPTTTQSSKPVRNFGAGLCGYTWEEGGASLAVRAGRQTLENHVEQMASLPFVDVLYLRCDWRDVQNRPGKVGLSPVWGLAFRVMLSNTESQPKRLALPDFLLGKVPVAAIGKARDLGATVVYREPRY